jgi:MoaA/NifB/PqqE/SkfB family radical SAM enzyme
MNNLFLNIKRALRLIKVINFNPRAGYGPLCLDIAITSRCNHKCIFCNAHSVLKPEATDSEELDRDVLEDLLKDCVFLGVREIVFSGNGEPFLTKGLPDIIHRFGDRLDIRVLTNGSTLDLVSEVIFARMGKLTISMNSIDAEIHRLVHGYVGKSQYPRIKANIERLLQMPDARGKIQINYVMCKDNVFELPEVLELARKWDIYFAIRPVLPAFPAIAEKALGLGELKAVKEEIRRFKDSHLPVRMAATLEQAEKACGIGENRINAGDALYPCYFGFYWGNIWSNGDYTQCTYNLHETLGNLKERRFRDIWTDVKTQANLYAAACAEATGKPAYQSCRGCMGPQLQSAAFHRLFKKTPFQLRLLKKRADSYAHMLAI